MDANHEYGDLRHNTLLSTATNDTVYSKARNEVLLLFVLSHSFIILHLFMMEAYATEQEPETSLVHLGLCFHLYLALGSEFKSLILNGI